MRTYTVLSPLDHDGKRYPIGAPVTLNDIDADILLVEKVIAAPEVAANVITMTLTGSDYLPALIRLTPELTVKQTEIVELAAGESGLDNAAWNALPDDEREGRIMLALEQYRDGHAPSVFSKTGLGTILAAAEGAKVASDNAALDAADSASLTMASEGGTVSSETTAPTDPSASDTVTETPVAGDAVTEGSPSDTETAPEADAAETGTTRRRRSAD